MGNGGIFFSPFPYAHMVPAKTIKKYKGSLSSRVLYNFNIHLYNFGSVSFGTTVVLERRVSAATPDFWANRWVRNNTPLLWAWAKVGREEIFGFDNLADNLGG